MQHCLPVAHHRLTIKPARHSLSPIVLLRYRQELQSEKRRNQEQTVALRSVQRMHSRPDSAINRALSGGVLSQPPTWGMGHTMSSVHLASSARERPATASATMRAGFVPSRSGAWSTPRAVTGGSVGAGGGGLPRESGPAYPA